MHEEDYKMKRLGTDQVITHNHAQLGRFYKLNGFRTELLLYHMSLSETASIPALVSTELTHSTKFRT